MATPGLSAAFQQGHGSMRGDGAHPETIGGTPDEPFG